MHHGIPHYDENQSRIPAGHAHHPKVEQRPIGFFELADAFQLDDSGDGCPLSKEAKRVFYDPSSQAYRSRDTDTGTYTLYWSTAPRDSDDDTKYQDIYLGVAGQRLKCHLSEQSRWEVILNRPHLEYWGKADGDLTLDGPGQVETWSIASGEDQLTADGKYVQAYGSPDMIPPAAPDGTPTGNYREVIPDQSWVRVRYDWDDERWYIVWRMPELTCWVKLSQDLPADGYALAVVQKMILGSWLDTDQTIDVYASCLQNAPDGGGGSDQTVNSGSYIECRYKPAFWGWVMVNASCSSSGGGGGGGGGD